jgi:fatty acid-binding protein DegV
VHHLGDPAEAEELADRLAEVLGDRLSPWPGESRSRVLVSEASAVIGAHVGPGLLAVVVGEG